MAGSELETKHTLTAARPTESIGHVDETKPAGLLSQRE
jgi:hypothetical protein